MRASYEDVVPERCERFRESVSLDLDGVLSSFESALLHRHLNGCASCEAFASAVTAQTALLRSAALEEAPPLLATPPAAGRRDLRRRGAGALAAIAVAAVAALFTLTPTGRHSSALTSAGAASGRPLLAVFPEKPSANATFDVPRLRVVSPTSADGAVHGFYGVPA